MHRINEFHLEPGVYRHHKGNLFVVTNIITHMDNAEGHMEPLQDPVVVYHDLENVVRHVNGRAQFAHQVYAHPLSQFVQKFEFEK